MKKFLPALFLILGCAHSRVASTSEPSPGDLVEVLPAPPAGCANLGVLFADEMSMGASGAAYDALDSLRRLAAKRNATHVYLYPPATIQSIVLLTGVAYRCPAAPAP